MRPRERRRVMIPARITASGLAEATGLQVERIRNALLAEGVAVSDEEYIAGETARTVAKRLGYETIVEPRDLILECLYALETSGKPPDDTGPEVSSRLERITGSTERLDATIERASDHWTVARMPVVDRSVLRLTLDELDNEDTPTAVVIAEGVRLAQTYSTEKSGAFVNGILAALAKQSRQ